MSVQRHPVDSFNKQVNFWEEFPDYKIHKVFGEFWKTNRTRGLLEASSLVMWGLSLCYDRKSSLFPQPEADKWELVSEELFNNKEFFTTLALDPDDIEQVYLGNIEFRVLISEFQASIDTPLGVALRQLEQKLADRTNFIMKTAYTLDSYETNPNTGKSVLVKGTADQLDRMFTNTDKITNLIQKALDALIASEGSGETYGGQKESLTDGDKGF